MGRCSPIAVAVGAAWLGLPCLFGRPIPSALSDIALQVSEVYVIRVGLVVEFVEVLDALGPHVDLACGWVSVWECEVDWLPTPDAVCLGGVHVGFDSCEWPA